MAYILTTTDFSEVAENAVHYACGLAMDQSADLTVMHSLIIPVTFSDTPMPVIPMEESREIAEERLNELKQRLAARYPGLNVETKVMYGDLVDCVEEYTEEKEPWVIVLGNSGSDNSSLWLGSNVLSALKHLKNTVIAVPPGASFHKPADVCFACDFRNIAGHLQTERLIALVKATNVRLHILNVDYQNKEFRTDTVFESTGLHMELSALNPVYHYVEKENTDEGIQEFIDANHMDWLVIVPHKHSFFEGLFHKSHTKAMVKMAHIPIVALHEK